MAHAVLLPGRRYGHDAPLMYYSGMLVERRGATVHRHDWSPDAPSLPDSPDGAIERWVCAEAGRALSGIDGRPLIIGKSLGTYAALLAAERSLPAVWLTPLLRYSPATVTAFRRSTAPFLLVGGTADSAWDGDVAKQLTPYVLEVPGADHGMEVAGPATASIEVLRQVAIAIDEFLDAIGWPPPEPASSA
ncbi:MAG TPA: alpha/beta hydrolase [Micromonosporaceae bacterium]|nr:alpha/beta hydrolase [Micromonosporaceae bacterium]